MTVNTISNLPLPLPPECVIKKYWHLAGIDGDTATVQRCISNYRIEERVKTDFMGREVFLNGSALDAINKAQTRWGKGFVFPQPDGHYYKKPKRFPFSLDHKHMRDLVLTIAP